MLLLVACAIGIAAIGAVAAVCLWYNSIYLYKGWRGIWPQPWQALEDAPVMEIGDHLCSPLWHDRIYRQSRSDIRWRIYMISATPHIDGCYRFCLIGQTNKVYEVTMGRHIACTCKDREPIAPDGSAYVTEGGLVHCKHLFWVKQQVLRIPAGHPWLYRLTFRPWELRYMSSVAQVNLHRPPSTMLELLGAAQRPQPRSDDRCIICLEEWGEEHLVECRIGCRHFFHQQCMSRMAEVSAEDPRKPPVLCPICKVDWRGNLQEAPHVRTVDGYTQLVNVRPKLPSRRRRNSAVRLQIP